MTLAEAVFASDWASAGTRLGELDDLWTFALETKGFAGEKQTVIDIGREMQVTLARLAQGIPRLREICFADLHAFETAADRIIAESGLANASEIRDEFSAYGWVIEVETAFRTIDREAVHEVDGMEHQIRELASGGAPPGDLSIPVRCVLCIGVFGATVGGSLASVVLTGGGSAVPAAFAIVGATMGLAMSLPGCRRKHRRSEADEDAMDQMLKQFQAGTLILTPPGHP